MAMVRRGERRIPIMKVVAINGSARKDGNTAILVRHVFSALEEEGIETESCPARREPVHGCNACYGCMKERNRRCVIDDDIVNECIGKMEEADGIILASPTYFADVSPEIKALMDRAGFVGIFNDSLFRRKVGVAVVAVRRGGAIHAFDTLNHFFFISQMVVPGSSLLERRHRARQGGR